MTKKNEKNEKRSVKGQLRGKPECRHKQTQITINRKGQKFIECLDCGAFLGFK